MQTDLTPDALKELLNAVLDQRSRIAEDTHREHHAWVQARIDRERARTDFLIALAAKSLPGIAWALLAAGAALIVKTVREHVTWS